MVTFVKMNKKNLSQTFEIKISEFVINKVNVQNVAAYFCIANVFHLTKLAEFTLGYIERCFLMTSETTGFLQLDHAHVSKILASSEVYVSSEIEIFSVADSWIAYDFQERSKYSENILLKVRLPLLAVDALKSILCKSSSFSKIETCQALIDEILRNTNDFYQTKSSIHYIGRYCSQKSFNITFLENFRSENKGTIDVKQVDGNNFESTKVYIQKPENSKYYLMSHLDNAVYSNGAVYYIGNFTNDRGQYYMFQTPIFIQKYSLLTETFSEPLKADFDYFRTGYCLCAFLDKIYIIGGYDDYDARAEYVTLEFDTEKYKNT